MGFECVICKERLEDAAPERTTIGCPKKNQRATRKKPTQFSVNDIVSYKCGHCFHTSCIEDWFASTAKRECPSCRGLCPARDMRKMYPSKDDSFIEPPTSNIYNAITTPIPTRVPTSTITGPGSSFASLVPTSGSCGNQLDGDEGLPLPKMPRLAIGTNNLIRIGSEVPSSSTNVLTRNARNSRAARRSGILEDVTSNNAPVTSEAADPTLHETLIADYEQLREQYIVLKEDNDLKTVLLESAQEHVTRLENELKEVCGREST